MIVFFYLIFQLIWKKFLDVFLLIFITQHNEYRLCLALQFYLFCTIIVNFIIFSDN
jgi:hypothetical protein